MTNQEFADIIDEVKDKMYRLALRVVRNPTEAEDVVQEVIIKVWDKRVYFESIENKAGWCMTLTRNLAIDKTRSKHRRTNDIDGYNNLSNNAPTPEDIWKQVIYYKKLKNSIISYPKFKEQCSSS